MGEENGRAPDRETSPAGCMGRLNSINQGIACALARSLARVSVARKACTYIHYFIPLSAIDRFQAVLSLS